MKQLLLILLCIWTQSVFTQKTTEACFPCSPKLEKPYGICAHISRKWVDFDVRDKDLQLMENAGINYVRTDFDWDALQKDSLAPFDFSRLDAMMESTKKYGIRVLPIFTSWLRPRQAWDYSSPWENYIETLVKRYGKDIAEWEVLNEINLNKQGKPFYPALLQRTYKAVKQANPKAKVLFSGLAGMDTAMLGKVCREAGTDCFDIMNFHYYSRTIPPERVLSPSLDALQKAMEKYRFKKPVWITETGYTTAVRKDGADKFYTDLLPQILDTLRINLSKATIGVVYDPQKNFDGTSGINVRQAFRKFKNVKALFLSDLKTLNPRKISVLLPSSGESFPMEYLPDLVDYVRTGGTVIFPYGAPLYYDCSPDSFVNGKNKAVGKKYFPQLHIGGLYWWETEAKTVNAPRYSDWLRSAKGFKTDYVWDLKKMDGNRYLTDKNLKKGDKFIPVMFSGNEKYSGCVIGAYHLNSDLKGNVIIQTRKAYSSMIDEETQAERLPRTYLLAFAKGVDKVFWYNLRARENSLSETEDNFGIVHKDLSPKPAYIAYQTLTKMCPDGSTRPTVQIKDGVYLASWKRPDGTNVSAVWTESLPLPARLKIQGKVTCYSCNGKKIKNISPKKIIVEPSVVYITGAKSISFL